MKLDATVLLIFSTAFLFSSSAVLSKSKGTLKVNEFDYKRANALGFKTSYPQDGPYVEVTANNTKYNRVLELHTDTQIIAETHATCSNKGKVSSLSVLAGSGPKQKVKGRSFRNDQWQLIIPRNDFKALKPIQQCNISAKDLAAKHKLKLADVVKKGFVVTLPRKLKVQSTLVCEGKGLQRGSIKSKSIDVDAHIVCAPNPLAGRSKSKTSTKSADPKKAKVIKVFESAVVNATAQCPSKVEVNADLIFKKPGKVSIQWFGAGGYKSAKKEIAVNRSGKKSVKHIWNIEKPKSINSLKSNTNKNQLTGWVRLEVTHTIKQGIARAKKNMEKQTR